MLTTIALYRNSECQALDVFAFSNQTATQERQRRNPRRYGRFLFIAQMKVFVCNEMNKLSVYKQTVQRKAKSLILYVVLSALK